MVRMPLLAAALTLLVAAAPASMGGHQGSAGHFCPVYQTVLGDETDGVHVALDNRGHVGAILVATNPHYFHYDGVLTSLDGYVHFTQWWVEDNGIPGLQRGDDGCHQCWTNEWPNECDAWMTGP